MTEASTRLDTIQRGNERAIAQIGGAISGGVLITNSLIKILNPRWEPRAANKQALTASPDLEASIKAKGWA